MEMISRVLMSELHTNWMKIKLGSISKEIEITKIYEADSLDENFIMDVDSGLIPIVLGINFYLRVKY